MFKKTKINLTKFIFIREFISVSSNYYKGYVINLNRRWDEIEWWLTGFNT